MKGISSVYSGHEHGLLPYWLKVSSGIILVLLFANVYIQRYLRMRKRQIISSAGNEGSKATQNMKELKVIVEGMTCNHCKMNIDKSINQHAGIKNVIANIKNGEVTLIAEDIDLDKVKSAVEKIGYNYKGIKK